MNPLYFRSLIEESLEPIVFTSFLNHWDILSWSLEKWAEILGKKQLPFRTNSREIDQQPQWENRCQTVHITMNQFLEQCKLNPSKWFYFDYKHIEEWFSENATILESVTWDKFGFPERKGKDSTLWIGSKGAHTPCHLDTYGYNLVAQVHGRKQWILFPPEATALMHPTRVPYEESSIYSSRNFNYPDLNMAADLQTAHPRVITLNPGDVLFVPHHWWHYVEHIDTAISINTWVPLERDNTERVNESLVRLFISQICKDLSSSSSFLNPNEVDLIDYPLSVLMNQTQNAVESSTTSSSEEQNTEPVVKKLRLSCEQHDDAHSKAQKIDHSHGANVFTVPKCLHSDFQDLLDKKRKALEEESQKQPTDVSTSVEPSFNTSIVQRVINSFCHPDVISLVKAKLMSETTYPNVSNI